MLITNVEYTYQLEVFFVNIIIIINDKFEDRNESNKNQL